MASPSSLDIQALEKVITLCTEQDHKITELQTANATLTELLKTVGAQVLILQNRLKNLEEYCSDMATLVAGIKRTQELNNIDTGADHDVSDYRASVVKDWMAEHDAGFNTDEIPSSQQEIKEGMDTLQRRRQRRRNEE